MAPIGRRPLCTETWSSEAREALLWPLVWAMPVGSLHESLGHDSSKFKKLALAFRKLAGLLALGRREPLPGQD